MFKKSITLSAVALSLVLAGSLGASSANIQGGGGNKHGGHGGGNPVHDKADKPVGCLIAACVGHNKLPPPKVVHYVKNSCTDKNYLKYLAAGQTAYVDCIEAKRVISPEYLVGFNCTRSLVSLGDSQRYVTKLSCNRMFD